jgi:hypothetical protein
VVGGSDAAGEAVAGVEQLPGYDECGSSGTVTWLTAPHAVTVAPGAAVKVRVTLDASRVDQAGIYPTASPSAPTRPTPSPPSSPR